VVIMSVTPDDSLVLVVPELGMGSVPVSVSVWLVAEGQPVVEGDRVVELVSGGATVDLEAPVTGRLVRQFVDEDECVATGMPLAMFEAEA
jgi:pyruvate/2-oxoglutarate dehydrogenase complex dihydrolipoamide acyltransferase (E2) component